MYSLRYQMAVVLLVVLVSFSLYATSYFVFAQRGIGNARWGVITWYVHYPMLGRSGRKVYEPLHKLDRKFLRPQFWQEDTPDERMIIFEP